MKTFKFFALAVSAMLVSPSITSCSNDDDKGNGGSITQQGIGLPRHLEKVNYSGSYNNGAVYDNFTYDDQNRITSFTDASNETIKCTYSTSSITLGGLNCTLSGNRITEIKDNYGGIFRFEYNCNNQLIHATETISNSFLNISSEIHYKWEGGNLIQYTSTEKEHGEESQSYDVKFTYDGTKSSAPILMMLNASWLNPLYFEINSDVCLLGMMGYFGNMITELPVRVEITQTDDKRNFVYELEYELDSSNYPKSAHYIRTGSEGQASGTYTYVWK